MDKKDRQAARAAERERLQTGRPEAGTVLGRTEGRPDYIGIQHPMRQADGPKARTLPGLGDVMKDLAARGGVMEPEPEEKKQETAPVQTVEYNRTHRQSSVTAARRRIKAAAEAKAADDAEAAARAPKSISSRSMQLQDKTHAGPGSTKPKADREIRTKSDTGRSIESAVDIMGGGRSGMANLLEAKAREAAAKKQSGR